MNRQHTYVPPDTGQPREIWLLFIVEMWERFSYYGMRALLVFYMTQTFLFSDDKSYAVYGSYTALVYLTPVFGGIIADRLLGFRKGVTVGALLMAAGHFCMAVESIPVFYFALALLIVGNGFFKPNMSTIVGQLYPEGDPRRDGGYTIFYMGVNVGAWLAPIACGWVGGKFGWHWGFTLAGFGMVAGLLIFLAGEHRLRGIADPPNPEELRRPVFAGLNKEMLIYIGAAVVIALCWQLIQLTDPVIGKFNLVGLTLLVLGGGTFLAIFLGSFAYESIQRHRVWVALLLTGVSVVFWACFEQGGSSLNLFTDRNVNKVIFGADVPAPVMQAINPMYIVFLLGPLFAWLWVALDRRKLNPTIPLKFGIGIVLLGVGFATLFYGAYVSRDDGIVPFGWLLLFYGLYTAGELCLSPVGLSMISKLAPPRQGAMMMGMWYLAIAFANYAAGLIAQLTNIQPEGGTGEGLAPVDTVMVYGDVFGQVALLTLGVGVVMCLVSPLVQRGAHGIK